MSRAGAAASSSAAVTPDVDRRKLSLGITAGIRSQLPL
jgi:hypothetical protein